MRAGQALDFATSFGLWLKWFGNHKRRPIRLIGLLAVENARPVFAAEIRLAVEGVDDVVQQPDLLVINVVKIAKGVDKGFHTKKIPKEIKTQEEFDLYILGWMENMVNKLIDVKFTNLDLDHLEAVSCLTIMRIGSTDLGSVMSRKFKNDMFKIDMDKFNRSDLGKKILEIWNKGLKSANLTSVGQLVGVFDARGDQHPTGATHSEALTVEHLVQFGPVAIDAAV